jgi:ABC-type uncharacterized transport system permease subunit
MRDFMPCVGVVSIALNGIMCIGRICERMEDRTIVMATVLALVAGGFRIVTRPIESTMARTIKQICAM